MITRNLSLPMIPWVLGLPEELAVAGVGTHGGMRLSFIPPPSLERRGMGCDNGVIAHGASLCWGRERKCWERDRTIHHYGFE